MSRSSSTTRLRLVYVRRQLNSVGVAFCMEGIILVGPVIHAVGSVEVVTCWLINY